MKRLILLAAAAALVLSVGTAGVFAACRGGSRTDRCAVCSYVDGNGDGICDNCTGCGLGYVDDNGDGVCDNRADGTCGGPSGRVLNGGRHGRWGHHS